MSWCLTVLWELYKVNLMRAAHSILEGKAYLIWFKYPRDTEKSRCLDQVPHSCIAFAGMLHPMGVLAKRATVQAPAMCHCHPLLGSSARRAFRLLAWIEVRTAFFTQAPIEYWLQSQKCFATRRAVHPANSLLPVDAVV